MSSINRLGTQVRLPDGREGTVVYNGLDGVGIKWGLHEPTWDDYYNTNPMFGDAPEDFKWHPDAMLREPYTTAELPCVGEKYEIIKEGIWPTP